MLLGSFPSWLNFDHPAEKSGYIQELLSTPKGKHGELNKGKKE